MATQLKPVVSLNHPTPEWIKYVIRGISWVTALWALALIFNVDLTDFGVSIQTEVLVLKYMASLTGIVSVIARFVGVKPVNFMEQQPAVLGGDGSITGYYVVIPSGSTTLTSVNGMMINMPFEQYGDIDYTPETTEYYGTIEWNNADAITQVLIDGSEVPVYPLIGGYHAPRRPK